MKQTPVFHLNHYKSCKRVKVVRNFLPLICSMTRGRFQTIIVTKLAFSHTGVIKQREIKDQHKSSAATEIKNQPRNQSVNSFDEDYSHDNVLHSYEEVTSSQFHRTYSQVTNGAECKDTKMLDNINRIERNF
ncbi:uncharacterized protein PHA67_018533 isoform 2-T3 [Liasis olivaceus]